ncbi:MAG: ABC transporter permease [Chloroflexi bacterium]|nr:ABC transporter permease [Chloroflexota bacterium]
MRFILRRLGFYLLAAWASLTINFFLPRLIPGDPASTIIASSRGQMRPEQINQLKEALGISDAPIIQQYFTYLSHVLRGDFGISFSAFPSPVTTVISTGLIWTLLLGGAALIISFLLGNLIGVVASWRRGGLLDTTLPPLLVLIGAFPPFFLALMALFFLGLNMGWFPLRHAYDDGVAPGWTFTFVASVAEHLLLPAITIVLVSIGGWVLGMRNTMIGVLAEDYITMAEAKGLSQREVMFKYAARNALLPSVTAFGMALGFVLSGQILIETIFSYPGLGYLLVKSVTSLDYPLMQGLFLMITFAVLAANFIVDVVYTRLDPRVRTG